MGPFDLASMVMCNMALLRALWDPSCNWELLWLILKLVIASLAHSHSVSQSCTSVSTVWLPKLQHSGAFDTWSGSIMSVKVWVMVPERFERPAPYWATDAQWGLLSIHFPWSWAASTFYSLERPLQESVMGIQAYFLSVVTYSTPVTRPDQTQACVHTVCELKHHFKRVTAFFLSLHCLTFSHFHLFLSSFLHLTTLSFLSLQPHEASREPGRTCSGKSALFSQQYKLL